MSGVARARALKVLRGKKFAFEDSIVPKVAFMLLDPSDIATITETFLRDRRAALPGT